MIKLYHEDIYMPACFAEQAMNQQKIIRKYVFSSHLWERINDLDRQHGKVTKRIILNSLDYLRENPKKPFEVETDDSLGEETVTKYVVRVSADEWSDISLVIRGNKVITAYINSKTDNHCTLNFDKYVQK